MISLHQATFLALAMLSALCGFIVAPYTLTKYNIFWIPRWMRPTRDYLSREYQYYYPAQETRVSLAIALLIAALVVMATCIIYIELFSTSTILLLYAALLPAYLLHRVLCFHKLNEFTPMHVLEATNLLNVYRLWKAVLLWLAALALLVTDAFSLLPSPKLGIVTAAWGGITIYTYFIEMRRSIKENPEVLKGKKFGQIFLELMPGSYYLVLAVIGVAFTQTALWLSMPILLVVFLGLVILFTIAEYHFRFVSRYRTDATEQWGEELYNPPYTPEEELWMIGRRNEAALRCKNAPCWVVITEVASTLRQNKIKVTANLEYTQREIELRHEKLLYIRRFGTVGEARSYAKSIGTSSLVESKIQQLNPAHDDLNSRSARTLSCLNTVI